MAVRTGTHEATIWRMKLDLYDERENWISNTDIVLDASMPISSAARADILADLDEIRAVVAAMPSM